MIVSETKTKEFHFNLRELQEKLAIEGPRIIAAEVECDGLELTIVTAERADLEEVQSYGKKSRK